MDNLNELLIYGLMIFGFAFLIFFLFFLPSGQNKKDDGDTGAVENFNGPEPSNFMIFNYFPDAPIKMVSLDRAGFDFVPGDVIIEKLNPSSAKGLTSEQAKKYIKPGSAFRFYIANDDGSETKIGDYVINGQSDRKVKNIHVGMVTTRYIGDSMDSLQMTTTAANANQGSSWVVIHNLTDIPLSFNNGQITVEPQSTTRYLGYLNQGVTLGTYFKEDSGLFADYQYLKPYNNLYYGVISDIRQPLEGCLQYNEFNDICDYGQTLWPFEEGLV